MSMNIGWIDLDICKFHVRAKFKCEEWVKSRARVGDTELRCGSCRRDLMTDSTHCLSLVVTNGHNRMPNFVVCDLCANETSRPEQWKAVLCKAEHDFQQFREFVSESPWKDMACHL